MDVQAVGQTTSNAAQRSTRSAASVDYNAFLRLLIAQLQNQDPLNPADSTEYMAQLAQFSSVEQSIQTNQKLDTLLTSMSLSQADALIGRNVASADGSASGTVVAINITSDGSRAILDNGAELELGAGLIVR
jgi:flagellar basal-body rod modification protein FlgD